ncbi:MAG: aminodeoxychorismate/anthranilate synthase component II [Phycisphaerales bacterium]|nr:aminodeoxychorismate/anthranilate synthase component II [Phycisphaerales bacterium]
MILLIDNYDSFTYNLVQRFGELFVSDGDLDTELRVVRNDQITPDQAEALRPSHIIISPGPCTPRESGVSPAIIERFAGRVPILGVCLGHQCIGDMHGMTVTRHTVPMHGKTSPIRHDGKGLFKGLSNPFTATRYHSLVVLENTVPREGWTVSAWTEEPIEDAEGRVRRVVMGLRRDWDPTAPNKAPLEGVQFHPESFLTTEGPTLLRNFLDFQPTL